MYNICVYIYIYLIIYKLCIELFLLYNDITYNVFNKSAFFEY